MEKSDLRQMYVPVRLKGHWEMLEKLAPRLREIEKRDEGAIGLTFIIVMTKGVGTRETFQGYECFSADVGHVADMYAEIWLKYNHSRSDPVSAPLKFRIHSHKVLVFE